MMSKFYLFIILNVIFICYLFPSQAQEYDQQIYQSRLKLSKKGFAVGSLNNVKSKQISNKVKKCQMNNLITTSAKLSQDIFDTNKKIRPKKTLVSMIPENSQQHSKKKFTVQEEKVWEKIKNGEKADLEHMNVSSEVITNNFLRTILSDEKFENQTPMKGIEITNAKFDELVNLEGFTLNKPLKITYSNFNKGLYLKNLSSKKDINFSNSNFPEGDIDAYFLKINGSLNLRRIVFNEKGKIRLSNSNIDGNLNLKCAQVKGELIIEGTKIGKDLLLWTTHDKSLEKERGYFKDIKFIYTEIDGVLQLRGSRFMGKIDLSCMTIKNELVIAMPDKLKPTWGPESFIRLRNTHVNAIQDLHDSWPPKIDIVNFVYDIPGGFYSSTKDSIGTRDTDKLIKWLQTQEGYKVYYYHQPYEQLAKVLKIQGRYRDAEKILISGKKSEMMCESTSIPRKILLFFSGIFIGFGYNVWQSCIFLCLFIILGIFALRKENLSLLEKIAFSLDITLPIINLNDEKHKNIMKELNTRLSFWFYFQKIFSFILLTFFFAGLSGLVK
jgi:hypothetical protein